MKDNILCRAKREDNGEWAYGGLARVCLPMSETSIKVVVVIVDIEGNLMETIPFSWCEYVGIKDKDGRNIYEGDIVKYHGKLLEVVFECRNGAAYYGMAVSPDETIPFGQDPDGEKPRVVGNVYDDPELIGAEDRKYHRYLRNKDSLNEPDKIDEKPEDIL